MTLRDAIADALTARTELVARLADAGTDCLRLFHGAVEGRPGLAIDKYGPLALVQTWYDPLDDDDLVAIREALDARLSDPPPHLVYNPRGRGAHEIPEPPPSSIEALAPVIGHEHNLRYEFRARHRGQDPWLFLDFRPVRRRVLETSQDLEVLNLFAYTCGIGQCAAAGGAREVVNVDFAASALRVGRKNLELNDLDPSTSHFVQADFIPYVRQLAGLPVKGRARRRKRTFERVEPRQFDLVVLDPPRWARTPFGAIDVVRDYPSLLKPSLLATRPGGRLICTNNVSAVAFEDWRDAVLRAADKAGRPVREHEVIRPGPDFPSPDDRPPLKVLVLHV